MAEPLSLEDAKVQLRVDGDDEDELILAAIKGARGWVESYTGLILTRRGVTEALSAFGQPIRTWPIVSIDTVRYVDINRQPAELLPDGYVGQLAQRPAALLSSAWPKAYAGTPIEVTMTAGFADGAAVDEFAAELLLAVRMLVAALYRDRETGGFASDAVEGAQRLCRPFKRWRVR